MHDVIRENGVWIRFKSLHPILAMNEIVLRHLVTMVNKKQEKKFISVVDKNSNENYQNRKSDVNPAPELYTPNYRRHSKITIPCKHVTIWLSERLKMCPSFV